MNKPAASVTSWGHVVPGEVRQVSIQRGRDVGLRFIDRNLLETMKVIDS
jgi:hypothetical protein